MSGLCKNWTRIGLHHDEYMSGQYSWTDGSNVIFQYISPEQSPRDPAEGHCVAKMAAVGERWKEFNCVRFPPRHCPWFTIAFRLREEEGQEGDAEFHVSAELG